MHLRAPAVAVLVLAGVAVAVTSWTLFFGCTAMRAEATEPGEQAQAVCVSTFTPWLILPLAPVLLVVLGLLMAKPWMAWSGAALQGLAIPNFFFVGTGWQMAVVATALLVAVGWWHRDAKRAAPMHGAVAESSRLDAKHDRGRTAVVATALALGALALLLVVPQIPEFWDPCHTWGLGDGGHSASASPGDPCASSSASRFTRTEQAAILGLIFGVPIGLSAAVLWASARRSGTSLVVAGVTLAVHAVFLYFLAFPAILLTWPIAALWIGTGVKWSRRGREAGPPPPATPSRA